ncbi:RNA ligase family protein [Rhizobium rhizogenes]|uniref:RNA ligase family protein n=1 Tax=Rhizobium rhizogenes TaxID=359 RepID=UPI00226D43E5|nr:RNA ligase family protein [Rhizobium rhizogenes]
MKITIPDREFEAFQKISRANKSYGCVITEKLDGTNAQILIENGEIVGVGSRNRWLSSEKTNDNYGFAGWVERNYDDLLKLGEGRHYGEWYGNGIQRAYGLAEKRFALFNVSRWATQEDRPACCSAVPVLYEGEFSKEIVAQVMEDLRAGGSRAAPGFERPEGIIIFLHGPRVLLKETFDAPHGKWAEAA